VTLSNIGPSDDKGTGSISIPGIGSGHVTARFHIASFKDYGATVSKIPVKLAIRAISIPKGMFVSHAFPSQLFYLCQELDLAL
jgi:hypothetical protein